ncbi:MAG TPA: hypothetical protein VKU00_25520 [Chthonomonadaceae bacterium]|nr:hypothetical protein [Chthonomonadaceae bacterium]
MGAIRITRSPEQLFVKVPVLVAEAKNEDMKKGYARCIAEMVGFRIVVGN